eukprot:5631149-Pleurochrysis_carterae.AAC.3
MANPPPQLSAMHALSRSRFNTFNDKAWARTWSTRTRPSSFSGTRPRQTFPSSARISRKSSSGYSRSLQSDGLCVVTKRLHGRVVASDKNPWLD